MPLETDNDLRDATDALKSWFISQELTPNDAVTIMEAALALLIFENRNPNQYSNTIININARILRQLAILDRHQ